MSARRCTVIFDACGLNRLADGPEWKLIREALGSGVRVRLTETSICELAATGDEVRRCELLQLCRHLICTGDVLVPYHEILQRHCQTHAADHHIFDWRTVDVRCPELEEEIARPTFLGAQEFADEVRADNRLSNKDFQEMWRDARVEFGSELRELGPVPVEDLFKALDDTNDPLWRLAANIYQRTTGIETRGADAQKFVEACPPVKAMLFANCVGQYELGLDPINRMERYKAGRLDLFSAAYLPYCDRFVTDDAGQYKALRLVADEARLPTDVCTYTDFRRGLLLAA